MTVTQEQSQAHYTVRDISIKLVCGDEVRNVKQMQYHSWPDHGVPTKSTSLLQFVRRSAQDRFLIKIRHDDVIILKIFELTKQS